jgi:hypothetical protein
MTTTPADDHAARLAEIHALPWNEQHAALERLANAYAATILVLRRRLEQHAPDVSAD